MHLKVLVCLIKVFTIVSSSFLSLPVAKKRYDSINEPTKDVSPHFLLENKNRLVKRDHPDADLTLSLKFDQLMYEVSLSVGSNNDTVILMIDTGSSDIIINSESNSQCLADGDSDTDSEDDDDDDDEDEDEDEDLAVYNNDFYLKYCLVKQTTSVYYPTLSKEISQGPTDEVYINKIAQNLSTIFNCMNYGVYNQETSNTFKNLSIPVDIEYADGTGAIGFYGTDDIYIGNLKIDNTTFGLNIENYKQNGVLGLGFKENQNSFQNEGIMYDSFPYHLKSLGIIDKVVYSIYASYGHSNTILFGAYDNNAYDKNTGLTLLPIINYTPRSKNKNGPYYISVTLNNISFQLSNNNTKSIASGCAVAILDTGTTSSVLPYYIFNEILVRFNFQWSSQLNSYVLSESDIDKDNSFVIFNFQNAIIKVPVIDFTYPVIDGDTLSVTGLRSISISSSDEDYFLLGDDFLSSAYLVVDLEDETVALGQSNQDIYIEQAIVDVYDEIVDAKKSSIWDYTYGSGGLTNLRLYVVDDPNSISTISETDENLQLYIAGLGTDLDW